MNTAGTGAQASAQQQRSGWGVTYIARVRISVDVPGHWHLFRERSGACHGIDAMKRALMTFGNPFGLALYDKQQRQVGEPGGAPAGAHRGPPSSGDGAAAPPAQQSPSAPAVCPAVSPSGVSPLGVSPSEAPNPALEPHDPRTIRQLQATIRALPQPVLEGFTKAFRKRFAVAQEAATIADRILQKQHHDWIKACLVQYHLERAGRAPNEEKV